MKIDRNFGKLNGGNVEYFTNPYLTESGYVCTNDADVISKLGYFPIVDTPMPDPVEGYIWVKKWEMQDGRIVSAWMSEAVPDDLNEIIAIMDGVIE